jgi:hypothetical protein
MGKRMEEEEEEEASVHFRMSIMIPCQSERGAGEPLATFV